MSKLHLYYDKEGDFLELQVEEYAKGSFKNLGDGIFERIDEKTKQVTGIAIMGFKKRMEQKNEVKISLPIEIHLSAQKSKAHT